MNEIQYDVGWRLIGRDDFGSRCDCECVACSVRIAGGAIGELLHCAWHGADAYAEGSRQRSWAQCRFSLFYSCVRKVVGKAVGAMYCSPSVFGVCPHVRRHVGLHRLCWVVFGVFVIRDEHYVCLLLPRLVYVAGFAIS